MPAVEVESELFDVRLETPGQIEPILIMFEERYEEASGTHLSSAAFYDRYRAGEEDHPVALAWATYYEAFVRMTRRAEGLAQVIPPRELAVC